MADQSSRQPEGTNGEGSPSSVSMDIGATVSRHTLTGPLESHLKAALAGGASVDDYYTFRAERAKLLSDLFDDLRRTGFRFDYLGDGTPVYVAQCGEASAQVTAAVSDITAESDAAQDADAGSVTYHCSGTVSLLAGTDMHQILNTGMTLTSIGVGLLITIAQRIGLQVLSSLFTSCISAGQALMWGGAAPAALATEVEMTATSAVAAGVDAQVEGAAMAVTTAAAASSVGAFVGPIVGLIGFAVECTDRMLVTGEQYLRAILSEYIGHYNSGRSHQGKGMSLRAPDDDHDVIALPGPATLIQRRARLGGLINEYRQAA
jgi:hypothetical protein